MSVAPPFAPTTTVAAGAVPEGKVADFLTGRHVRDTPEEYVRQNLEKALVRQYKYDALDCEPEFTIKVGSSRKRVDVVVFAAGTEHKQENAYILVEDEAGGRQSVEPDRGHRSAPLLHGGLSQRAVRAVDER